MIFLAICIMTVGTLIQCVSAVQILTTFFKIFVKNQTGIKPTDFETIIIYGLSSVSIQLVGFILLCVYYLLSN